MDPQSAEVEDPLIAALPPNTDYMTYLTLLEYQLNAKNLSTLNRLLSQDDGTLASEIGWDLPKMVLPMLQVVPAEANRCFEIIARRGNPREVIVRIAEELERLGQHDSEYESEFEQDNLPTFAGEATRIHLGEMKLDGMPEEQLQKVEKPTKQVGAGDRHVDSHDAESRSDDGLKFKALVNMLGILHPRIKTQHPSRFLATSLPAALGAYRRLSIDEEATILLLNLLEKLSGKQRPALPPRTSTAGSLHSIKASSNNEPSSTAALPDPESKQEQMITAQAIIDSEKAITQKLLQAVLLEIVDDYSSSLLAHDIIHMQWTNRQREKVEPEKVMPGRTTVVQHWQNKDELKSRDSLMERLLSLAKDLSLDLESSMLEAFRTRSLIHGSNEEDDESNVETEYPQSPSDIPFPPSGLLILKAAQQFYQTTELQPISVAIAFNALSNWDSMNSSHSTVIVDAMLSIVYTAILTTIHKGIQPEISQDDIMQALKDLTSIFTSSANIFTRDNAHHVAKTVLHNIADLKTRIQYLKSLLNSDSSVENTVTSIQSGNLKAIAVTWLKDEFLASTSSPPKNDSSIDPGVLSTDTDLVPLLFPDLPSLPGPFISSHPPDLTTSSGQTPTVIQMSSEADLESFLRQIPYFVASLNLITILSSISTSHNAGTIHKSELSSSDVAPNIDRSQTASTGNATEKVAPTADNEDEQDSVLLTTPMLLPCTKKFIQTLKGWQTGLASLLGAKTSQDTNGPLQMSDLYSLEDALGRVERATSGLE